jgi:hypothetical protein
MKHSIMIPIDQEGNVLYEKVKYARKSSLQILWEDTLKFCGVLFIMFCIMAFLYFQVN